MSGKTIDECLDSLDVYIAARFLGVHHDTVIAWKRRENKPQRRLWPVLSTYWGIPYAEIERVFTQRNGDD